MKTIFRYSVFSLQCNPILPYMEDIPKKTITFLKCIDFHPWIMIHQLLQNTLSYPCVVDES